jgi:hypothetical protein
MARGKPLSLSDAQMTAVATAARALPSWQRCNYLRIIADQLEVLSHPSDACVDAAIRLALRVCAGNGDPGMAA